jgi:hypothetical protein
MDHEIISLTSSDGASPLRAAPDDGCLRRLPPAIIARRQGVMDEAPKEDAWRSARC